MIQKLQSRETGDEWLKGKVVGVKSKRKQDPGLVGP